MDVKDDTVLATRRIRGATRKVHGAQSRAGVEMFENIVIFVAR